MPDDIDIYQKILEIRKNNGSAAVVTVVQTAGSTPRKLGTKMIVFPDGTIFNTVGGGAIEKTIIQDALDVLTSAEPKLVKYQTTDLGMCCGGEMELFIEPLGVKEKLIIFGAGHVGAAVARVGKFLNFHVTVVDDRPEYADQSRIPEADRIIAKYHEIALQEIPFDLHTHIVIAMYDHRYDTEILLACGQKPFAYLGMIGSKRKAIKALNHLRESGMSEETVKKIHTPIGLNIGAQTPEEIAVSILSEIVSEMKGVASNKTLKLELKILKTA
jgi:xanthine dehydrogenase accessory factor